MKNHQARPTSFNVVAKEHATTSQGHKGHKKRYGCGKKKRSKPQPSPKSTKQSPTKRGPSFQIQE